MSSSQEIFISQLGVLHAAYEQRQSNISGSTGVHTAGASKDLQAVRGILDLAERIESHDRQSEVVTRAQGQDTMQTAVLPFAQHRQAVQDELQDLRAILSNSTWTKADDACLKSAVLNDCRRVVAYHLRSRFHQNPISAVDAMTQEQLYRCAVPRHLLGDDDEDDLDFSSQIKWEDIASELSMTAAASTKSAAECQTRWLMVQRPGLDHAPWSETELQALKTTVEQHTQAPDEESTPTSLSRIDWRAVSTAVGNRRSPIECVTAYQRRLCSPDYDGSHLQQTGPGEESAYDEAILHMVGVWGFNWPLIGEKLNRHAASVADRYTGALDERLNIGPWSEQELEELAKGVGDVVRQQRGEESNPALMPLEHASKGVKIEWNRISQYYVGSRTWRQCRDRWNKLVKDSEMGVQKAGIRSESKARKGRVQGKG